MKISKWFIQTNCHLGIVILMEILNLVTMFRYVEEVTVKEKLISSRTIILEKSYFSEIGVDSETQRTITDFDIFNNQLLKQTLNKIRKI